ncbi:MAG: hypothetical protein NTW25_11625 [Candidatus Kapabacteria bacterium]|nr:hypothetical protein [Candidatus Kapabacteria bacterium]
MTNEIMAALVIVAIKVILTIVILRFANKQGEDKFLMFYFMLIAFRFVLLLGMAIGAVYLMHLDTFKFGMYLFVTYFILQFVEIFYLANNK